MGPGLAPIRQLTRKQVNHFLNVNGGRAPHLRRLPWHFRSQSRDGTTSFDSRYVLRGQVGLHHCLQRKPRRSRRCHTCRQCYCLGTCAVPGFCQERIPGIEMRVEAAVRQAGFSHDVRNTSTAIAGAPNSTRRNFHDTLVRFVFAARQFSNGGFFWHDDHHIPISKNALQISEPFDAGPLPATNIAMGPKCALASAMPID